MAQHRALVWGIRRPRHARHHDLGRRDFGVAVSFHSLHLWNLPAGDRHSNAFWKDRRTRFREEHGDAFCRNWIPITQEFYGEHFKARVDEPLDAHTAGPGVNRHRCNGLDFRGRFHPGSVCDHAGPIHRLYVQYLRDSRPAIALFSCGALDGPFRLPEDRSRLCARLSLGLKMIMAKYFTVLT